jgi:hypothetical protein
MAKKFYFFEYFDFLFFGVVVISVAVAVVAAAVDVDAPAVTVTAGIVGVATHAICAGVVAPVFVVVVHAGRRRVALKANIN